MKEREILSRLILKDKVVGYEKHEGGKIYHALKTPSIYTYFDDLIWDDILGVRVDSLYPTNYKHPFYISHDHIDAYTGVDIDGVKVFERDSGTISGFDETFICEYENGYFVFLSTLSGKGFTPDYLRKDNNRNLRITGIEGVKCS